QKELADLLEISRSHLSEIESGKKKPSYDLLERYAKIFNVPISNLLFFSEYLESDSPVEMSTLRKFVASKIVSMMEFVADKHGKESIK
ncbi:MAG: helix-turn-helix domain-containing protein, partial [Halothece sp.]